MTSHVRHRPTRRFPGAERTMIECDLNVCVHGGGQLSARKNWHMRKTVQTLTGPLFVAGRGKECRNPPCGHAGIRSMAGRVLLISLP
jgi:hypothetical protein